MNRTIIRSIKAVLEDWAKLDDKHKGQLYNDAVKSLEDWKKELENNHDI